MLLALVTAMVLVALVAISALWVFVTAVPRIEKEGRGKGEEQGRRRVLVGWGGREGEEGEGGGVEKGVVFWERRGGKGGREGRVEGGGGRREPTHRPSDALMVFGVGEEGAVWRVGVCGEGRREWCGRRGERGS